MEKLSSASIVTEVVVAAVGVPDMTPVEELKERPAGKDPDTMLYVWLVPWVEVTLIVCE